MAARQHGAKAMIVVTGPRSPNAGELAPMTFDTALAGSGIIAVTRQRRRRRAICSRAPARSSKRCRNRSTTRIRTRRGSRCRDVTAHVHADVVREKRPATTSSHICRRPMPVTGVAKPWVAIGAHYDHLGHGEAGNTLAAKDEPTKSTPAPTTTRPAPPPCSRSRRRSRSEPRKRNVLVAFWSGEELGLIGSSAFAASAAGAARSDRRVSELRHGRPHAGQQADGAGDRAPARPGRRCSSRRTSPPASTCGAGGSVSADRCGDVQLRRASRR